MAGEALDGLVSAAAGFPGPAAGGFEPEGFDAGGGAGAIVDFAAPVPPLVVGLGAGAGAFGAAAGAGTGFGEVTAGGAPLLPFTFSNTTWLFVPMATVGTQ